MSQQQNFIEDLKAIGSIYNWRKSLHSLEVDQLLWWRVIFIYFFQVKCNNEPFSKKGRRISYKFLLTISSWNINDSLGFFLKGVLLDKYGHV